MASFCSTLQILLLAVALFSVHGMAVAQPYPSQSATSSSFRFVENRGQIVDDQGKQRPDIHFMARSGPMQVYLRNSGISYVFTHIEQNSDPTALFRPDLTPDDRLRIDSTIRITRYRMDMEMIGANPSPRITSEKRTGEYVNYYLAHCPNGITGVGIVEQVTYHDIYPDIDLVLHGTHRGMKYDFVVRPGGRVEDIRLRYLGADSLQITPEGTIHVGNPAGTIEEGKPLTFQQSDIRTNTKVGSHYRLNDGIITFSIDTYNPSLPLIIDPTLVWATYMGGTSIEYLYYGSGSWGAGQSLCIDRQGKLVFAGASASTDFPTSIGAFQTSNGGSSTYDGVVVKMDGNGNRVWSTYFGGSSTDYGEGVAVDTAGNIYMSGVTSSSNFPITPSAFQTIYGGGSWDVSLAKFDSTGLRLWSTYFGGNSPEWSGGVAVDSTGNVILSGVSSSTGLATTGAFQTSLAGNYDAFVSKFTPNGARIWSTYFGGTNAEYYSSGVCTDRYNNIIVAGTTLSTNLPVTPGAYQSSNAGLYDGFVVKFSTEGLRRWSTYLGGASTEYQTGVATDRDSNIIVTTYTTSSNFPTTSGVMQTSSGGGNANGTITKFRASGTLAWSTYCGGSSTDWIHGVVADQMGNIVVAGYTQSNNFPITADAFQSVMSGYYDACLVKLDSLGRQVWGTFLGGSDYEWAHGIAIDRNAIYVAGTTLSNDFPITHDAYQGTSGGNYDFFIGKFCDITPVVSITGATTLCPGESVTLSAPEGFDGYLWSTGARTRTIVVTQEGSYYVTAAIGACSGGSDTVRIKVFKPVIPKISPSSRTICQGDSIIFSIPRQYASQRWSTGDTTPSIIVRRSGVYYVDAIDSNGCTVRSDTATATVNALPQPVVYPPGPLSVCAGDSVELDAGEGYRSYLWSNFATTRKIRVGKTGTYSVRVTNQQSCEAVSLPVSLTVRERPDSNKILTPLLPLVFCQGDSTIVAAASGYRYRWSTGDTTRYLTLHRGGIYSLTVIDSTGCTTSKQFKVDIESPMMATIQRTGPSVFCEGDSIELIAPDFMKNYRWSTGANTRRIIVRKGGNYSVSFTTPGNCPGSSDTVRVTVSPRPVAVINGPVTVCANSVATYSLPKQQGVQYLWNVNGAGGSIQSGVGTAQIQVQWGATGTGQVHATAISELTGCATNAEMSIDIGSTITPSIVASPNPSGHICRGDSVTLDAGAGYTSYLWSNGATTQQITVADPQPYTVTVTEMGGCSGVSAPFIVTINNDPTPTITALGPTTFCPGDSVILDAGDHADYEWSNGASIRRIVVRTPGVYSVTVVDSTGCEGTSYPVVVGIHALPTPSIDGPNSVCAHATAIYKASGDIGDDYQWSISPGGTILSGQGTPTVTVRWGSSGDEKVDVIQTSLATGCQGVSERYSVQIDNSLAPKITATRPTIFCQGDSTVLWAPTGYETYRWSNGATTRQITVDTPGVYSVAVTSSEGCTGSSVPVTVTVVAAPVATVIPSGPLTFCEGDSVTLSAPAGFLGYLWSNGATTPSITVGATGDYSVTVTNTTGCTGISLPLHVKAQPQPEEPLITQSGDSLSTATTAVGYQWIRDNKPVTGATGTSIAADTPGVYRLRVTGAGGCYAESAPFILSSPDRLYTVYLDTVSAVAGERLSLRMRVTPKMTTSDSVTGYRFQLHFNQRALYPLSVHPSVAVTGNGPTLQHLGDGTIIVEFPQGIQMLTGTELFRLEMQGLVTGQPVNDVVIEEALINGINAAETGNGLVFLSGCDIGRDLSLDKAVAIRSIHPNPVGDEAIITYRAPAGSTPQLVITDMTGRELIYQQLPAGTGEEQTERVQAHTLASGVYRFEIRDRAERSIVPVVIVR